MESAFGVYWQADKRFNGRTHRLIEKVEHVNASMASEWQAKNQHGQGGCHHHLQSRRCHGDLCFWGLMQNFGQVVKKSSCRVLLEHVIIEHIQEKSEKCKKLKKFTKRLKIRGL